MNAKFKEQFEQIGGEDALDMARDFLYLYAEYLRAEELMAVNSINLFQNAADELPSDFEAIMEGDDDDEEE